MAKMHTVGFEDTSNQLDKLANDLRRSAAKRIVDKGAEAAAQVMKGAADSFHHVVTGEMRDSIAGADYKASLSSWEYVYPQGTDSRGYRLAMKAYVINYGIGKRPNRVRNRGRNKTGDKFITKSQDQMDTAATEAMEKEMDRILEESGLV